MLYECGSLLSLGLQTFVDDVLRYTPLFNVLLGQFSVFHALQGIMHDKLQSDGGASTPRRLKDAIAKRQEKFAGTQQQDAHEFLTDCLDELQEEMAAKVRQAKAEGITPPLPEGGNNKPAQVVDVDAMPSQPSSSSSSARSDPLLNLTEGDLPFALNFTTQIEHELTCTVCQHSWTRNEILRHFSLDLPEKGGSTTKGRIPSVQSIFGQFMDPDDVEVKCEQCQVNTTTTVRHRIVKLPRILILHVKRFASMACVWRSARIRSGRYAPYLLKECCKEGVEPLPPPSSKGALVLPAANSNAGGQQQHRTTTATTATSIAGSTTAIPIVDVDDSDVGSERKILNPPALSKAAAAVEGVSVTMPRRLAVCLRMRAPPHACPAVLLALTMTRITLSHHSTA